MRSSMVRSLLQSGIERSKSVPRYATVPFSNKQQIRLITMAPSITQADSLFRTNEIREMMALWPGIVKDLTENGPYTNGPDATKWIEKMLQYNVPNSQKHRAMTLIHAYHMLARPEQLTEENKKLARLLGWCFEMNQTYLLLVDDVFDNSELRRGQPCWFRVDNLGVIAVNDGLLIDLVMYQLMSKYFRNHKNYSDLVEMFQEASYITSLAQTKDFLLAQRGEKKNFNFTMDQYNDLAYYKCSYYICYFPVKLVMHFLGIPASEKQKPVMDLLVDMGHLYLVQDDYLDCYGDSKICGEIGNDIKTGKCTWFIVQALQQASPSQRRLLEECYGYDDEEKLACVKQVYDELELLKLYTNYEEETYKQIKTRIQQISCGFPQDLLLKYCSMYYRRDK